MEEKMNEAKSGLRQTKCALSNKKRKQKRLKMELEIINNEINVLEQELQTK